MFLHTSTPYWDVLGMYLKQNQIVGIPKKGILNHKAMVPWIYMKIHLLLHICKHVKF
jgi:hypothetical protein